MTRTPRELIALLKQAADVCRATPTDLNRRRLWILLKDLTGDEEPSEAPSAAYMLAIADDLVDSFRSFTHARDERN